jgi:HEAT repeat protein
MLWWTLWRLKSSDPAARARAARALDAPCAAGNWAAAHALRSAFGDPVLPVRRAAAAAFFGAAIDAGVDAKRDLIRAIGGRPLEFRGPEAAPCLDALLFDADEAVRVEALEALLSIATSSDPPTRDAADHCLLGSGPGLEMMRADVRQGIREGATIPEQNRANRALQFLGTPDHPGRLPLLLEVATQVHNDWLCDSAIRQLGEVRDGRLPALLIGMLDDPAQARAWRAADEALSKMDWEPADDRERAYRAIARRD